MATQPGKVSRFVDVDVVIEGLGRIDGYEDGTSISVAYQNDRNTVRVGNDGIPAFAESQNRHAIVTLSLLESSDSNDLLSLWIDSGLSRGCSFLDRNGRTLLVAAQARVRQKADVTKSAGVETRAWDIHCASMEGLVGGLNNPAPAP